MCVWSAYIGKREAAPELWRFLCAIEGIWGGFYTGLVTLDGGVFHHRKLAGNTRIWAERFSLSDLPGTIGLAHSRTDSGGDDRWSHPFLGSAGKVALIGQGSSGIFTDNNDAFAKVGNMLLKAGKVFETADFTMPHRYPVLDDGSQVHCSEIAAAAVEYYYEQSHDPVKAIRDAFLQMPEEAASLILFSDLPDTIGFVNMDQRVIYQRNDGNVYLSISTLGFPTSYGTEIPGNSVGIITPDRLVIEKLSDEYAVNPLIPPGLRTATLEYIKEHPGCHISTFTDHVLRKAFPAGDLVYRCATAYRILESLVTENEVVLKETECLNASGIPGRIFLIYPA